ncbi:MAG: methylmalonyl-CoA carboxyltransferase, partial [Bacteroidales bacterium]|nr:methylmalonyl-CoA carboxyltransferase [Bacteroidales bacterium]
IAVMGPQGAIEVLEGKTISEIDDPKQRKEYVTRKEDEYRLKFANPYEAAKYGYLDDVIEPRNTRFRIIRALRTLSTKKDPGPMKKHSNIPL